MVCLVQSLLLAVLLPYALAAEYLVGVGKDETTGQKGIGFDPSAINPAAGDVIVFEFRSGQHSVVQSTFDDPCVGNGGFNSGIQTVSDSLAVDAPGLPTVRLTVNDTNPLWFFDDAGGECNKGGVLAINPSGTQSAATFKDNAAAKATTSVATSATSTIASSPSTTATSPTTIHSSAATSKFSRFTVLGSLLSAGCVAFFS
ncbi:hypothetical protein BDZ97DRAFT_381531 [Flammula alnicola]|nr:hypothetical protein BDZ97DRAFT_381531 [Flammula alnicola]